MIHTATLTTKISYNLFMELIITGIFNKHSSNEFTYEGLREQGISQIRTRYINVEGFTGYFLILKINFLKLAFGSSLINTFTIEDLDIVEDRFNYLIKQLHSDMPEYKCWTANRVDYSINIRTQYVKEYILLFQRAKVPYPFKIPLNNSRHRNHREGSMYLYGETLNINFYDKQNELINCQASDDAIKDAENVLRLEIQCKKRKLDTLKKKYCLRTKSIIDFADAGVSKQIIKDYYINIVGKGDFYSAKEAEKKINEVPNHVLKKTMKSKLINIVKEIAKAKGVQNYLNKISGDIIVKRHMKRLNEEFEINPIIIPREWNIKKLNSLLDYIDNAYKTSITEIDLIDDIIYEYEVDEITGEILDMHKL